MATILRGKYRFKECRLHQWCNNWFSVEVDGKPIIVSPTNLQLNTEEVFDVINSDSGILFNLYKLTGDLKFKKI